MIPISICMIAKDEEKYIEECLKRLAAYPFELIVVDTGSTDNTVEIAHKYTEHVFYFPWVNDFSAARNYSIKQASNEWILVIDCDELLEEIDISKLICAIKNNPTSVGMIIRQSPYQTGGHLSNLSERVARLFSKNYYHYEGIIHEQVTSKQGSTPVYFPIPLCFYHQGYAKENIAQAKAMRNLDLLLQDLEQNGENPYTYFQIGKSYTVLKEIEKACHYYDLGVSMDVDPQLDYVQTMVESYGYCLLELKRYTQALQFEQIYDVFAVRADFCFLMGLIYMNNALFNQAIEEFKKATTFDTYSVEGVNSYSAYFNIGVIYECMGDTQTAKIFYKKCNDFEPAYLRLKEL